MAWDEEQWEWSRLPGGPRGFKAGAVSNVDRPEVRHWRPQQQDQRMSRMDKARKGQVQAVETGRSPLEVILDVMRNGKQGYTLDQIECAKAALPYLHARLANTTVTHRDDFSGLDGDELRALLALAERLEREEAAAEAGEGTGDLGSDEPPPEVSSVH